ncbi:MAG: hypothetical protein WC231_01925 [Dehalococcoidales bacterium]
MAKQKNNKSGILPRLGTFCLSLIVAIGIMGVGYAAWIDYVDITGTVTTSDWSEDVGGTIGFWGAWDNHETYSDQEIEDWLVMIDNDSAWLGPTTTSGMEGVFDNGTGNNAELKFLAHYLACRLDGVSDRLSHTKVRDISGYDPTNYLGLGGQGTLDNIFTAIEAKHGTSPTKAQFNLMKDICNALNNLLI